MLHHVELYVGDLERATAFWTPLMELLGYDVEPWSGGTTYLRSDESAPYLTLVPASADHLDAGYHRKRIGLNHLAFRARDRAHVDEIRAWAAATGHPLLYDDRYPFATAPGYYAVFVEDPDRLKVEVVAPHQDG